MKLSITFFVLFFTSYIHSQIIDNEISSPNYITTINVLFYKDSWIPFTGNILTDVEYKNKTHNCKTKFENGFEVFSEIIDPRTKKVVFREQYKDIHQPESAMYDSINLKTEFKKSEKITDTTILKKYTVTNYFFQNKERTEIKKLNGFVKSGKTKAYFANGMVIKVEYFYDSDLKKIKESYEIFHTEIGNIDSSYQENSLTYDGEFKKWDINGILIEIGKYKEGKKI